MQNVFRISSQTEVRKKRAIEGSTDEAGGVRQSEQDGGKYGGDGELKGEDREPREGIFEVEKKSNRGRMDKSTGEEEIHRGREMPSIPPIQREMATAEGQDRDFSTDPRGTERAALSRREKHNYYYRQPPREWNKKQRVSPGSRDARKMTTIWWQKGPRRTGG